MLSNSTCTATRRLLRDFIPRGSLDAACVYFPDPWSDDKGAHRRIVNPFLLALLEPCMRTGEAVGEAVTGGNVTPPRLHLSTDDAAYSAHMLQVMAAAEDTGRWVAEPRDEASGAPAGGVMLGRAGSTKYEERGRAQGSSIHNFCYRFVGGENGSE